MHAVEVEHRHWTRTGWWSVAGIILAIHFGMIFWLSARPDTPVRPPMTAPAVQLLTDRQLADLPGLKDPTLFVLPSRRGFSGPAWLNVPVMAHQIEEWPAPTRLLPMPVNQLAAVPAELVRGNASGNFQIAAVPGPQADASDFYHTNLAITESSFVVQGDLRQRRLLSNFQLNSQPAPEILSNSVVRIVVDAEGRVSTTPILLSKSGSPDADQKALTLANTAKFERLRAVPGRPPPPAVTAGELVFRWHTVPVPVTNAPPPIR